MENKTDTPDFKNIFCNNVLQLTSQKTLPASGKRLRARGDAAFGSGGQREICRRRWIVRTEVTQVLVVDPHTLTQFRVVSQEDEMRNAKRQCAILNGQSTQKICYLQCGA